MLLIGCRPPRRFTEQHDVFFGIGESVKDLIPQIKKFWPEAKGKLHVDAWHEVNMVNGYTVTAIAAESEPPSAVKLFFINLGGYKKNEFEEFHYKMIIAAVGKGEAVSESKKTAFYKHTGFASANSHVDDKYGIDVDDVFEIEDILGNDSMKLFQLKTELSNLPFPEDEIHLGYFKLEFFQ